LRLYKCDVSVCFCQVEGYDALEKCSIEKERMREREREREREEREKEKTRERHIGETIGRIKEKTRERHIGEAIGRIKKGIATTLLIKYT